jgi:hypothetical protein
MQTSLELEAAAVVASTARNGITFSQYNVVWEAFHRLGVQYVKSLILIGTLFLLDGGRRRERKKKEKKKKKKSLHGEEGYPGGWIYFAGYAVVRSY